MKNKFMYAITLVAICMFVVAVPGFSQANRAKRDSMTRHSERLEQRAQGETNGRHMDDQNGHQRPHYGGKQNFQGRNFEQRGFYNGRPDRPGFNRGSMHHRSFDQRGFRNPAFRNRGYGPQSFGHHRFDRQRSYQQGFKHGKVFEQGRQETKALREKIWKDGVMDLKERDVLRDKMKAFRNGPIRPQNNEHIRE